MPSSSPKTKAPTKREAVSVRTAAELLDVHEMTVYRLVWAGTLGAFRVGRHLRIRRDVLLAYIDAQKC